MSLEGNGDFYLSVQINDVNHKVWFDHVMIFSRSRKISEQALEELQNLVREDMPSVHDYLTKENKNKIMRTIVEGVPEWKETYEDFYKFKGNHKKNS
jgi:hypothetical protein